jgi:YHS domain-containing protein
MFRCLRSVAMVWLVLGWSLASWAAGPVNINRDGVALHGHDPVAYFVQNKPAMGEARYTAAHQGATYWFASEDNRQTFAAAPDKYTPQYGGYCAYGVSQGAKPDIDPAAFAVVGGKLYLNLNPAIQQRWQQDIPGYIKAADAKWPELVLK